MKAAVTSWKGVDKGTLQTTERFKNMALMEEISIKRNNECKCCNHGN